MYRAYLARASQFFEPFASTPTDSSEPKKLGDNAPLIERILTLRQEKAALLGYDNFAEVSMAKKMATLATAESLLEDIRAKSFPAAERELEEIRAFAAERGAPEASTGLMQWDVGFWAERLREAKYELKEEDLRPYFQLPAVIDGMFELAEQLFGVKVEAAGPVAGINQVDWDAVELPSQFMENFCYDKKVLKKIGKHHETGEPLPDDLFEKLVKSKNFGSGTRYLRQCHFAMTDLELHARYKPGEGADAVFAAEAKIATKTMLMPAIKEDRFLCGFGHIFAGGYSAGYYSYLWAEVLSADAFGAFEEAGALEDEKTLSATGGTFAGTVLAMGGGAAPMEVLVTCDFACRFRKRAHDAWRARRGGAWG